MIPEFSSGMLNGNPTLLQYIPGKHVLNYGKGNNRKRIALHVHDNYPETGVFEIEVDIEETMEFPLVLRVPAWAEGFEARVASDRYLPSGGRLMEIKREWSPGDRVQVTSPLEIRVIPDGDKTTEMVAFARGPQILATDKTIDESGGIPESGWWGNTLYKYTALQQGTEKTFLLVNYADAGQTKAEYVTLHEGIELP